MKKIKNFLNNVMKIEESKKRMQEVLKTYPDNTHDEELSKSDLEKLITEMALIIGCNKENNIVIPEDNECLATLKELLIQKS